MEDNVHGIGQIDHAIVDGLELSEHAKCVITVRATHGESLSTDPVMETANVNSQKPQATGEYTIEY